MSDEKKPVKPEVNDDRPRHSRRRLIQLLTAGGVVTTAKIIPGEWTRPVVESVSLPAHAQTTEPGEIIVLGNNSNLFALSDQERPESLLASGVEDFRTSLLDSLVEQAHAGDDPGDFGPLFCELTGCARIRFRRGSDTGTIYFGIFDGPDDAVGTSEFSLSFRDGKEKSLDSTCIGTGYTFIVNLLDDDHAKLILRLAGGGKGEWIVDLFRGFLCEPIGDTLQDDN